jgi:hypothetical protein
MGTAGVATPEMGRGQGIGTPTVTRNGQPGRTVVAAPAGEATLRPPAPCIPQEAKPPSLENSR